MRFTSPRYSGDFYLDERENRRMAKRLAQASALVEGVERITLRILSLKALD